MKNKLIVIEGLDGSGKATQTALLRKELEEKGMRVRQVSFPNYESDSSALVRMYLAGQFGSDPADVNAYAASSFYAVDRFAGYKKDWKADYREGIIVADRYTTSNAIHQCSKLDESEWEAFLKWLFEYEYELLGIPTPDLVIYLAVDVEVSQTLMTGRYGGDEGKKDIHESNTEYLHRSRRAAAYCREKLGWKTVACNDEAGMRSIEDIHREVMKICGEVLHEA